MVDVNSDSFLERISNVGRIGDGSVFDCVGNGICGIPRAVSRK